MDKENLQAWDQKGVTLFALGRYEEAMTAFDQALKNDRENPAFLEDKKNAQLSRQFVNKGYSLVKQGLHEEAVEEYDKALNITPFYYTALLYKADALWCLAQYDALKDVCEEALLINPNKDGDKLSSMIDYCEQMSSVSYNPPKSDNKRVSADEAEETVKMSIGILNATSSLFADVYSDIGSFSTKDIREGFEVGVPIIRTSPGGDEFWEIPVFSKNVRVGEVNVSVIRTENGGVGFYYGDGTEWGDSSVNTPSNYMDSDLSDEITSPGDGSNNISFNEGIEITSNLHVDDIISYELPLLIKDHTLSKNINEYSTTPYDLTDSFYSSDERVISTIHFNNPTSDFLINWNWYDPDGNLYATGEHQGLSGHDWAFWYLSIQDYAPALRPGVWRVDLLLDGKVIDSKPFTIIQNDFSTYGPLPTDSPVLSNYVTNFAFKECPGNTECGDNCCAPDEGCCYTANGPVCYNPYT